MTSKTAFIAEDEPLAREALRDSVQIRSELKLIGEADNGRSALEQINQLRPDVVFMDIQMPEMTGLEVIKRLDYQPQIIFTTAYDQYAVTAFELNALDYLLKPFSRDRFDAAIDRLLEESDKESVQNSRVEHYSQALEQVNPALPTRLDRILVRDRGHIFPVNTQQIAYLKSDAKYTALYVDGKTFLVRLGISELAERLDPARFIRIHRSVLVNLDFVDSMKTDEQSQLQLQMRDGTVLVANRDASKMLRDMAI
ncbi:response regulator transcription factor [Undibacterium sp. LX40W]|uniref:Response regulator transcription factor n=1 Tax=Undibacterium nitidum TaxID=2762298 RepID=A0A923HRZ5_9BURK|nr:MULTISPECIES: LytTR family DNA-binding domain-containing protein [Undibacterium]MBC3882878.1 response regulator transcription factor [Undibacterium nitidum]MBC3893159.1 response regulator transcription factor [Undibacterium sp. LX40W]